MIAQYEPELICDFAETYHILDYTALPVSLLVTLFSGLGEGSRVQQRLNGERVPLRTLLLAAMVEGGILRPGQITVGSPAGG